MAVERVGRFVLTIERDAAGRVVGARDASMRMTIDWNAATATLSSTYSRETWAGGRATGTWLDVPYGHEDDVDDVIGLDAWVERNLLDMRAAVFWQACDDDVSDAALRAIFRYAQRHVLLLPSVSNVGARAWAEQLAGIVDDAELAALVLLLDDDAGRELLAYVK